MPSGLVSDFSGTLSTSQLESVEKAVKNANDATGLDGRVVIVQSTKEWYLDEYAKDYGNFLQAKGVLGSR